MLKKCLALCLALTLLGAGALAGGQIVLSAREDHPRFYSTGESGDPEAARGLRFSLGMILGSTNGELGWDVSGRPAENVDAETALRYEAGGRAYPSEPSPYSSGLELSYPLLSSFGTATNTSFSRDDLEDTSFWASSGPWWRKRRRTPRRGTPWCAISPWRTITTRCP